jgi:hypothetical protein
MSQNTRINISQDWTLLTNANVAVVTFQNVSASPVYVQGTSGTTPPAAGGGFLYAPGAGEEALVLADLFPGVASVARLWARVEGPASVQVQVSHA